MSDQDGAHEGTTPAEPGNVLAPLDWRQDKDILEARSRKWGGGQIQALPLESGAWATWDYSGELTIWPGHPDWEVLRRQALIGRSTRQRRLEEERRQREEPIAKREIKESLEDLGL